MILPDGFQACDDMDEPCGFVAGWLRYLGLTLGALFFVGKATWGEPVAPFSAGPLLLQPSNDSVTIVIHHRSPVEAVLSYRRADGGGSVSVRHDRMSHHVFHLDDLDSDTEYEYEITSTLAASGPHRFRTLPAAPERYRFLALGDVRTQITPWQQLAQRILENEPDALFTVGTGDYATNGRSYDQWVTQFFAPARRLLAHLPFVPSIGNHEATAAADGLTLFDDSEYFNLFELPGNERWYRFDYRYLTLLVVDSTVRLGPEAPQYEWLRTQLRSLRKRFTVVAFHHAPFSSGPHLARSPDGTPREWPVDEGRRFLVPLFELYDVDLVLSGHDHLYERSEKAGVTYIVTGGGGAPLYPVDVNVNRYQEMAASSYHYVSLDVGSEHIDATAIDLEGEIIERHRIEVEPANLDRRAVMLQMLFAQSTRYGTYDATSQTIDLHLSNPFDESLEIQLTSADPNISLGDHGLALQPGEHRALAIDVSRFAERLMIPKWRPSIYADVEIVATYNNEGFPLELLQDRRPIIRHPSYDTRKVGPDPTTHLPELNHLEPILLDEKSSLVAQPATYHGADDLNGEIRFAWEDGTLHFAADINDDRISSTAEPIDEDNLYLVLKRVSGAPVLLTFAANGRFQSNVELAEGAVRYRIASTDGGYSVRAAVPFEVFREEGAGPVIEVGLLVNDDDSPVEAGVSRHRLWSTRWDSTDPYCRLQLQHD